MDKQIKPRYTNKEAEKYSDENIKIFLGTIKYFDKLAFDRSCIYKLKFYRGKLYSYEFDNLFDAMRFLLAHKDSFIEYGFIELHVVYTDDVDDFDFSTLYNESNVLKVKYNFEKYSKSCIVIFSKDLDQVYMVNLCSDRDFSGYEFSYDMKFLYDEENCIKLKPYTAYTTDIDFGDVYLYKYKKTNVKVPWFITDCEYDEINKLMNKFNCSGYGIGGSFQISYEDGRISTDDTCSSPHFMMPMAAIHKCNTKRPSIKGITRYKFIIRFPDGRKFPHYVECKTGDMDKAIELLTDYDWIYDEINENPKDYIESVSAVLEGEWF